jgi:hypothetical protein
VTAEQPSAARAPVPPVTKRPRCNIQAAPIW